MKIASIIKAGWAGLLLTTGGTLLFAMIAAGKGLPTGREVWLNLWPLITGAGMIASAAVLRAAYRKEPPPPGYWHLSVRDLVAASMSFGTLLLIGQHSELEFCQAVIIAVVIAGLIVVGFLRANRRRIQRRFVYAIAFAAAVVGSLVIGGVLTIMVVSIIFQRDFEFCHRMIIETWQKLKSHPNGGVGIVVLSMILTAPAIYLCNLLSTSDEREPTPSLTDSYVSDAPTANRGQESVL